IPVQGESSRMTNLITLASAQMGPIARAETRSSAVARLVAMMPEAKARSADIVVFPELALTSFFPRWVIEDEAELEAWFEREMPGPETKVLFEEAARLGIGFYIGYAELVVHGNRKAQFNNWLLIDKQ